MKYLSSNLIALALILSLSACASTETITPLLNNEIIADVEQTFPEMDLSIFGEPIPVGNEEQLFKLSEQQISDFLKFYKENARHRRREVSSHIRVYQYLQSFGERFTYIDKTNDAETTLRTASGNCMSLAILTTALTRLVNVHIKYELVSNTPIYQEFGSVIFNSQHVRSVIYEPMNEIDSLVKFKRGKVIIDYYPIKKSHHPIFISDEKLIGRYYHNLAAEALGENKYSLSFWLLKKSLTSDINGPEAINTMAVLHKRVGENEKSEALYKYGLKYSPDKLSLLKNYLILLESEGRMVDADRVAKELEGLDNKNPFDWLFAANEAYAEPNYHTALKLYKKSTNLAPYLHQGYLGIAKTEYQLGNLNAANRALKKAKAVAPNIQEKSLYAEKLEALSKERVN